MGVSRTILVAWLLLSGLVFSSVDAHFNYRDALKKSLIFLEAQRSGKLPPHHRPSWRGDSGLDDGRLANVDLVGGYYDAGDNVKFGLPMAFTVTTLSWAALYYKQELRASGELAHVRSAIRWGTDYFLKAAARKNQLYVEVGDPVADHSCWIRPENMKTPRTVLKIDEKNPGTEIAAETAAALAASAIVFRHIDHAYSRRLLNKAKMLFQFANSFRGTYEGECPFYCSFSGYNDELLWAATWLYEATRKPVYLSPGGMLHVRDGANTQYITGTASLFSVYSDILAKHHQTVSCGGVKFGPAHLMAFAKQQVLPDVTYSYTQSYEARSATRWLRLWLGLGTILRSSRTTEVLQSKYCPKIIK